MQRVRRAADVGPVGRQRTAETNRALAPYPCALALVALLGLLALRLRRPELRRILTGLAEKQRGRMA